MKKLIGFWIGMAMAAAAMAVDGVPVPAVQWFINPATGKLVGYHNIVTHHDDAAFAGTATNNNASAGDVGEVIASTIATGSSVSLSTGTPANVTSVSLTAGDWDCTGVVDYTFGGTTSYTQVAQGISTTSATLGAQDTYTQFETVAAVPTAAFDPAWAVPTVRQSLAGTTTVYLVAKGTFTVSTLKAYGTIRCRRMR